MVPRKDGLTPQERLARLAGAARPASERDEVSAIIADEPENVMGHEFPTVLVTSHVTTDVTPQGAGDPMLPGSEHASGDVSPHVTRHVPVSDASHTTPQVTTNDTSSVTADDVSDMTKHVTSYVTGDVTSYPPSNHARTMTVRVRGRWTQEQREYIDGLAKEQQATAGEIVRYIVAWYLAQEIPSVVVKSLAPSADGLVKRETGFKVLDFLTTPDQAAALKRAAGAAGEAALMRRAMDEFKVRGPLKPKK